MTLRNIANIFYYLNKQYYVTCINIVALRSEDPFLIWLR